MWIPVNIYPLKEGIYTCLVIWDDFFNLVESNNEHFTGVEWSHMDSSRQGIMYWKANEEDYKVIYDRLYKEKEEYDRNNINEKGNILYDF